MPQIKFKHVVSCSSEDKVYKAENLLKPDTYLKWKSKSGGESDISIVLQFEKESIINTIDIGNEGSAFVECLVGRSSDAKKEFQVLLVASSFMSPLEGRNWQNPNRVRIFDETKLSQKIAEEKWDLVKIVCTQPFNKTNQYGLSFIKLHSPSEDKKDSPESKEKTKLGAFTLKADDEDNAALPVGSFFAKRKNSEEADPLTSPAAIRNASNETTSKFKKELTETLKNKQKEQKTQSPVTSTQKTEKTKIFEEPKRKFSETPSENKRHKAETPEKKKNFIPFDQIMSKVVFVLSGFQNPHRGDLREKAIEMGAKYRGDWNKHCTHLVCAFVNTPKYLQVRGQDGRVVTKEWILDCYSKKKLLPWRDYMLGNYSRSSSESDTEDKEVIEVKKKSPLKEEKKSPIKEEKKIQKSPTPKKAENQRTNDFSDEDYGASTDVDDDDEDEMDTEDELRIVREKKKRSSVEPSSKVDTSALPLPPLLDIFAKKHFFFYGTLADSERKTLSRYIVGYNGILEDYMGEAVTHVITNSKWDDNFNEALEENENLVFVKPQWVYKCVEKQRLLPHQAFVVAPS